jgi:two-component system CheB/CheR fusion protein
MAKKKANGKKKTLPASHAQEKAASRSGVSSAANGKRERAKKFETPTAPGKEQFTIVGIGASAGGLEAIEAFFQHMDPKSGMAFVLVQHLDPTHKSILSELVARFSSISVQEVTQSVQVEPNHVYVIPPGRDLAILNGRLQLLDPSGPRHLRLSIDYFFRSLAREVRDFAVGIVLSGTGTDGTLGIRAIKGEGGLVLVQDPTSAAYDGMPRSAIATGLADAILKPAEMARQLLAYAHNATFPHTVPATIPPESKDERERLFVMLRDQTGHDFSLYKDATITRRIMRRMTINGIDNEADFIRTLQQSPTEVDALWKEFLIRVTQFFRDPEVFEALEKTVIPALLDSKGRDEEFRIWVPACSTGEEAYSIAMLMCENLDRMDGNRDVQIFATDIDQTALEMARAGIYPESIVSDVSKERLSRFFNKTKNTYVVGKELRRMLVFSSHDVIKDPPFSRMDLVSCRNLLIYMKPELQARVLGLFHYALQETGFLMLGNSETTSAAQGLFSEYDRKMRLYRQRARASAGQRRLPYAGFFHSMGLGGVVKGSKPGKKTPTLRELTEAALIDLYSPTCVVVDELGNMLYVHGQTGAYLEATTGEANLNIARLARDGLCIPLSAALRKASVSMTEISCRSLRIEGCEDSRPVDIKVRPLPGMVSQKTAFMVSFEKAAESRAAGATGDPEADEVLIERATMLEQELASTREVLQTSNEELQTSNEELSSTVEELQSTNEELLTSQEELRSVNEELLTVNAELEGKLEQLAEANADKENLLTSTEVGTIFLDLEQRVKWFSPAVANIVYLIESDIGRPIAHVSHRLKDIALSALVEEVLETLKPTDREVCDDKGAWYDLRITLYRTENHAIAGTVVSLFDISERKRARQLELFRLLLESSPDAIVIADAAGEIVMINNQTEELFGWARSEVVGRPVEILVPQRLKSRHRKHRDAYLQELGVRSMAPGRTLACQRKDGSEFFGQISLSPIESESGTLIYTAIRDVSAQTEAEQLLRRIRSIHKCIEYLDHARSKASTNGARNIRQVCKILVKEGGYTQCWVGAMAGKGKKVSATVAQFGFPKRSHPHAESLLVDRLQGDKAIVIREIMTDRRHEVLREFAEALEFESLIGIPLRDGNKSLGLLGVHALEPTAFNDMERDLLRALSMHLLWYFTDGAISTTDEIQEQ